MTDEELTERDRRELAQMSGEVGTYEFPIRVPIFVPNTFGQPAMEIGVGVFENEDRLVIDFLQNAPGRAVRRIMKRDIVLGLQFVMLELETKPTPTEETNEGDSTDGN